MIRAKVFARSVCKAGIYRKVLDRQETCPFGKVFVTAASSLFIADWCHRVSALETVRTALLPRWL